MKDAHSRPALQAGLRHAARMTVSTHHTVSQVADWPGFSDMPPVFATAMMVGFMEQTCIEALRPCWDAGQRTVGTHVDMSHVAATPVGMVVEVRVELVEVQGRALVFKVSCSDDAGLIGEGMHRRAMIDLKRFEERLTAKAAAKFVVTALGANAVPLACAGSARSVPSTPLRRHAARRLAVVRPTGH